MVEVSRYQKHLLFISIVGLLLGGCDASESNARKVEGADQEFDEGRAVLPSPDGNAPFFQFVPGKDWIPVEDSRIQTECRGLIEGDIQDIDLESVNVYKTEKFGEVAILDYSSSNGSVARFSCAYANAFGEKKLTYLYRQWNDESLE